MEKAGLTRSISAKVCSHDNPACEGFFGRFIDQMFYGRNWNDVSINEYTDILDKYVHWYADKKEKNFIQEY